eukprot:2105045-Pyramimonas_sp.AAC.1
MGRLDVYAEELEASDFKFSLAGRDIAANRWKRRIKKGADRAAFNGKDQAGKDQMKKDFAKGEYDNHVEEKKIVEKKKKKKES